MSKVSISQCNSYEFEEVKRAIYIAVEKLDFPDVLGKNVLLKPNILSDSVPEKAITTNPAVLRAVISLLKDKGVQKIYVGDSPAMEKNGYKAVKSGIYEVCKEENVEWVDFSNKPVNKKLPILKKNISIASIIDHVDLSISLAKFKTHSFMYTTGAVKNMFGLVPGIKKSVQHLKYPARGAFAKLICDIATISKSEFAIMDAVVGMEGLGPNNGTPRNINKIIAGKDLIAVDIAQAIMMGYEPMKIPIIKYAIEQQILNVNSIDDIEYPLFNANDLIMRDFKRIGKNNITDDSDNDSDEQEYLSRPAPKFNDYKCIKCKKCVNICPAHALEIPDGKVIIDESKCIRCYCCHEVCPVDAIDIID